MQTSPVFEQGYRMYASQTDIPFPVTAGDPHLTEKDVNLKPIVFIFVNKLARPGTRNDKLWENS